MILSINRKIDRLIMDKDYYIGLRIYQEKVQNQNLSDLPKFTIEIIKKYVDQGCISRNAEILTHFSVLAEVELVRAEISMNLFDNVLYEFHYFS